MLEQGLVIAEGVYNKLISVLGDRFDLVTRDQLNQEGKLLIDHLAVSGGLTGSIESVIAKRKDGKNLSDHSGVLCKITSSAMSDYRCNTVTPPD